MKTDSLDFHLPRCLIAKTPAEGRDVSRLLVLCREGPLEHRRFRDIKDYLRAGDLLVINDSKVIPARLTGRKAAGGRIEVLLLKELSEGTFSILSRGGYTGRVRFDGGVEAEISGGRTARFNISDVRGFLWRCGAMPLPPYIDREPDERDRMWYQTVYAEKEGSIAAPTAGLHFTEELLEEISDMGVVLGKVTLHVGAGTFRPIRTPRVQDHRMEPEEFEVDPALARKIRETKGRGGRVFAVGTTTTRTLEALMSGRYTALDGTDAGTIRGTTDLFIHPGYRFRAVDCLVTNFHLPRSTPLALVSALAGRERILEAYREAVALDYRFFSYGDAMLIL